MLRYLIPRMALRDLPPMIGAAVVGALIAGLYGALHDQVTYTISPEYFTKLKFHQFDYADFGLPQRVFVAEIGFLATWWVGFVCAWFLARRLIPNQPRPRARRKIAIGLAIILSCALLAAGIAYAYGLSRGPEADVSAWQFRVNQLGIDQGRAFIRVAYMHNAGYAGGLVGLIVALICVRRDDMCATEAAGS